jgi:hypothetical protein
VIVKPYTSIITASKNVNFCFDPFKKKPKKNPKEEVETDTSCYETGKEKKSNHIQTFHLILLIITGKKRKKKTPYPVIINVQ